MAEPSTDLAPGLFRAIELAWESIRAGSLGIGAVATTSAGAEIAAGRNRLFEGEAGDDHLAGSSLAHAELNVLAKLRYRAHEDDDVELYTTLQPCVQCLGAIRLSPVRRVHVLAPDPLWIGIERMRELTPFLGRTWPEIDQVDVTEWSVLGVLLPTHQFAFFSVSLDGWEDWLPRVTALSRTLVASNRLVEHVTDGSDVVAVAAELWDDLADCVDEVAALASVPRGDA